MELTLRRHKRRVDFKAPRDNRLIEALMCCAMPLANWTALEIEGVKVDEESSARPHRLSGQRAMLMSNHPTDRDAVVTFQTSRLVSTISRPESSSTLYPLDGSSNAVESTR